MTTRNVAIAGAVSSLFSLYALCTFSANEFKNLEYRQFEDGSKGYVQVVDVKTHSISSRLLAAMLLLGFSYVAYKAKDGVKEEKVEVKKTPAPQSKGSVPQISLETPALFQGEEDESDLAVPVTQVQKPVYDEPPAITSHLPTSQEDLTSKVLSSLYHFPKRHLIVIAETGAGKTTLLLSLVKTAYASTAGSVDMYLCTVKAGNWLGLEHQQDNQGNDRQVRVDQVDGRGIEKVMKALNCCREKLNARGEARKEAVARGKTKPIFPPIIFIIDEMNTLLDAAKKKGVRDDFVAVVNAVANTGREDNVRVWIFGQDYQVQNLGINTGYRGNFGFALLGQLYDDEESGEEIHAYEKMEAAFVGNQPLYSRSGDDYWNESISLIKENKGSAVIWTSLTRRACLMPYLPKIEYETLWETQEEGIPSVLESASIEEESQEIVEDERPFAEATMGSIPISLSLI